MFSFSTRSGRCAALLSSALALALAGCATVTGHTFVGRDVDLARYRTYSWGPADTLSTGDPRLDNNRFFDERIRLRVDETLALRGFEKAMSASPDLLVHYHASMNQEIDVRNLDREYPYNDTRDCGSGDCDRPYVYDAGTLFIDLVEPSTRTLIWRGWEKSNVDGLIDDQDALEKRIDQTVARILGRLPRVR